MNRDDTIILIAEVIIEAGAQRDLSLWGATSADDGYTGDPGAVDSALRTLPSRVLGEMCVALGQPRKSTKGERVMALSSELRPHFGTATRRDVLALVE